MSIQDEREKLAQLKKQLEQDEQETRSMRQQVSDLLVSGTVNTNPDYRRMELLRLAIGKQQKIISDMVWEQGWQDRHERDRALKAKKTGLAKRILSLVQDEDKELIAELKKLLDKW